MNRKRIFVALIAAAVLASSAGIISSCQPESFNPLSGQLVRFTAVSGGSVFGTKASYSGVIDSGKERINWQEGDLLRIYCAQAGEPESKVADYIINDDSVSADGAISKATIIVKTGDVGLRWGENEDHIFYAVYPSPAISGTGTDELGNGTMKGTVPAVQAPLSMNATAEAKAPNFTAGSDLKAEYMVATNTIKKGSFNPDKGIGSEDGVFLNFKPIVTAIEFTITNAFADDEDLNIKSIQLISASHNISGTFTADLTKLDKDGGAYPPCTSTADGNTVTMDFTTIPGYDYSGNEEIGGSKAYVTVEKDQTLRFTFFLKPEYANGSAVNVDDLTFRINKADGSWVSTKLAYNDAAKTGVAFPCHKKTYVTGILVPEGAQWTVKYDPEVVSWNRDEEKKEDPEPEFKTQPLVTPWEYGAEIGTEMYKYSYILDVDGQLDFGHEGTSSSILTVLSNRELFLNHAYIDLPVIWRMEYWDESASSWTPVRAGIPIKCDGVDFLTLNPTVGPGGNEEIELGGGNNEIAVTVAPSTTPTRLTHAERLRAAAYKGSSSEPYDLSMYDIYGNRRAKPVTANSYVISSPGFYAIPLVYGNGVDFTAAPAGGINTPAFNPGGELESTSSFLSRFLNSKGNPILSPYIDQDLGVSNLSSWSAFPLWQDVSENAIMADDACYVLNAKQASAKGLTACSCSYVTFEVTADALTQGNVVLAVKDAQNIVWSWHIWVTDANLTCVSISGGSQSILPVDLGWVDSYEGKSNYYDGASVRLRAVQDASNMIREFSISRRAENDVTHTNGSSPYWQWGRKDPFLRDCPGTSVHSGYSAMAYVTGNQTIAFSIANPYKFVVSSGESGMWYTAANSAAYRNLWSAINDADGTEAAGYSSKPAKTIYDPSPAGFQVPCGNTFAGFDATSANAMMHKSGYRSNTASGDITGIGGDGRYWTAVPYATSSRTAVSLNFTATSCTGADAGTWSHGYSVRPVCE